MSNFVDYSNANSILAEYANAIKGKASKVANATSGNLAALDANGNITDSGKTLGVSVPADAKFTDTTYSAATTSAAGLMSADDKTKLNGVATGAEVNQNAFSTVAVKVGTTTTNVAADSKTDTVTLIQGNNVTLTPNATNDTVTIAATDTTYSNATQSAAGLMSASDKTKLDGVATGATANVGTITGITMNGASKGTSGVVDLGTVITSHQAAVKYDTASQGLNDTQKSNARTNIGAGTSNFSGSYNDLSNKPTIPTVTDTYSGTSSDAMSGKAVKSAIDALDGTVTGSAGAAKTLTAFSQTDGKVSATFGDIAIASSQVSGLGTAAAKAYTTSVTSGSNDLVTSGAVYTAIDNLPEPMVFKGSVGTGGTITTLPTASSENEGFTYKVITALSTPVTAKVGDTVISNGSTWVVIPSGDEPSGTVTSVGITNGGGLTISGSPVTSSGNITVGHSNSVTAGTAKGDDSKTLTFGGTFTVPSVTYDANGHITSKGTTTMTMPANPNTNTTYTLSAGSGDDANKIVLTPSSGTANKVTVPYASNAGTVNGKTVAVDVPSGAVFTDTKNTAGSTDTSSKIYLVGATSQAANPQTYSDNECFVQNGAFSAKTISATGADYAEKFNNPDNIDYGYFVTIDCENVKLAEPDDYILGVTSNTASVVCDKEQTGIEVGLLGKLWVKHDGTAKVNKYVTCGINGIATYSDNGYRVMAIDGDMCRILFR